jgi:hypothetical protein
VIPEAEFIIKSVVLAAKLPKKIQKRLALQFGKHFPEILELQCEI